jgi:hypothetical protein
MMFWPCFRNSIGSWVSDVRLAVILSNPFAILAVSGRVGVSKLFVGGWIDDQEVNDGW